MKKIIIMVFLTGLSMVFLSTSVFAYNELYIDGIFHGPLYLIDVSDNDASMHSLGFKFISERTYDKFEIEYLHKINDVGRRGLLIRNGIVIGGEETFLLYGNFSVLNLSVDSAGINEEYWPVLLGIEAISYMNNQAYIDGSIDYAVAGCGGDIFNTGYMGIKVKYNFPLSPNMGASFGYNWSMVKIRDHGIHIKDSDSGYTMGLFYQF
jgi:hypothetical protein